jgi:hypothetical protein
MRKTAGKERK